MSTLDDLATSAIRWQRLGYGAAIVAVSGIALASNNHRMLFDGQPAPAAFAAVPGTPDGPTQNGFVAGPVQRFGSFAPGGRSRRGVNGLRDPLGSSRVVAAPADDSGTSVGNGVPDGGVGQGAAAPVALADNGGAGGRGGGVSFAPDVGGAPAVGGLLAGGGTGSAPTTTSTPTPTPVVTPTPTPVVTAVPEAATWAMLLTGFAMIGSSLRRRRTSGSRRPGQSVPAVTTS